MKRFVSVMIGMAVVLQLGTGPIVKAADTNPTELRENPTTERAVDTPATTEIVSEPIPEATSHESTVFVIPERDPPVEETTTGEEDDNEESPLVLPPLLVNRVVAGVTGQTSYEFIELYNPNPQDVFLDSLKLTVLRKDGDIKQEFTLHGGISAEGYMLVAGVDPALDEYDPAFRLKTNALVTTGGIITLAHATGAIFEEMRWGDTGAALSLKTGDMLARQYTEEGVPWLTGDNLKDFVLMLAGGYAPRSGGFTLHEEPVNRCTGVVISEIAANVATDKQFVELYNSTNQPVTLDGCSLQTNRSSTKSHVLGGNLLPGGYKAYYIDSTSLTLTKTTSGTVYLLSSDGNEETDARSYDSLAGGHELGAVWKR